MNQDKRNVGTSIKNEYKNFFYVNALKDYVYLNQYVGKRVKVVYNRENAEIIRAGILEKVAHFRGVQVASSEIPFLSKAPTYILSITDIESQEVIYDKGSFISPNSNVLKDYANFKILVYGAENVTELQNKPLRDLCEKADVYCPATISGKNSAPQMGMA